MSADATAAAEATATTTMPPPPLPRIPLTLIVAATPSLGIGKNGTLPWPQLKKEMAYFARVTKRVPSSYSSSTTTAATASPPAAIRNAVIMGRKTWDSIPPRFRPLRDRVNVVVSRTRAAQLPGDADAVLAADSLQGALEALAPLRERGVLGRVFVIGGAALYRGALEEEGVRDLARAVLLTKVWREYECDTKFPVDLDGGSGWVRRGNGALGEFVGEMVEEGRVREEVKGEEVEFEFCLYERED